MQKESHNLHLAWCYYRVQLKIEIATLEVNTKRDYGRYIRYLALVQQIQTITIHEARTNEMILNLNESTKRSSMGTLVSVE